MRIRQFIPVLFALLMPMVAVAQGPLDVMPTATYTDDEGNLATADKDNPDISGQAPLFVNFYANPTDMGVYIPSYEWHFRMQGEEKDFMVRYEENTDYTFTTAGTTLVTLRTTLNQGELEIDSVVFKVTVSESKLSFPNAFSPNNGDGENNTFKVKEYQSIVEFHAYIFNRYGQKLYEWTDLDGGWDGTHNGHPVKDGVYFVYVKARGADGKEYNIRRDVNLIRKFNEVENTNNP